MNSYGKESMLKGIPIEIVMAIVSGLGAALFFTVKHIVNKFTEELKTVNITVTCSVNDLKKQIAKLDKNLAINSQAIGYWVDEIKEIKARDLESRLH